MWEIVAQYTRMICVHIWIMNACKYLNMQILSPARFFLIMATIYLAVLYA